LSVTAPEGAQAELEDEDAPPSDEAVSMEEAVFPVSDEDGGTLVAPRLKRPAQPLRVVMPEAKTTKAVRSFFIRCSLFEAILNDSIRNFTMKLPKLIPYFQPITKKIE
jgi:hypothetical protein